MSAVKNACYVIALMSALSFPVSARAEVWNPGAAENQAAENTLHQYLGLLDQDNYEQAYKMLSPELQKYAPFDVWKELEESFNNAAGGAGIYNQPKVSWFKNPPMAPEKGVYVTYEFSSRYPSISECRETIVMHENNDDSFEILRHDRNVEDKSLAYRIRENARQEEVLRRSGGQGGPDIKTLDQ